MPINQESVWTKRYQDAGEEYLFGTEPNRFLAHRAELLQDGRTALSVADGVASSRGVGLALGEAFQLRDDLLGVDDALLHHLQHPDEDGPLPADVVSLRVLNRAADRLTLGMRLTRKKRTQDLCQRSLSIWSSLAVGR